jgi:hypothetical protein
LSNHVEVNVGCEKDGYQNCFGKFHGCLYWFFIVNLQKIRPRLPEPYKCISQNFYAVLPR